MHYCFVFKLFFPIFFSIAPFNFWIVALTICLYFFLNCFFKEGFWNHGWLYCTLNQYFFKQFKHFRKENIENHYKKKSKRKRSFLQQPWSLYILQKLCETSSHIIHSVIIFAKKCNYVSIILEIFSLANTGAFSVNQALLEMWWRIKFQISTFSKINFSWRFFQNTLKHAENCKTCDLSMNFEFFSNKKWCLKKINAQKYNKNGFGVIFWSKGNLLALSWCFFFCKIGNVGHIERNPNLF